MSTENTLNNQGSQQTQEANKPDGHWIDRLCEAFAEAFEDESLPDDAYNALVDAMNTITEIYETKNQINPTEARTLLRDALRKAVSQLHQEVKHGEA